jgi:hypothetical protein
MVQLYTTEIQLHKMTCCKITGELETKKVAQLLTVAVGIILQTNESADRQIKGKFVVTCCVLKECPRKMQDSIIGVVHPEKI